MSRDNLAARALAVFAVFFAVFAALVSQANGARAESCGPVELDGQRVRMQHTLPTSGSLSALDKSCLSVVAEALSRRAGLRSVTIAARVPRRARQRSLGLTMARSIAAELTRGGVRSYLISSVAPALAPGESPRIIMTFRAARGRRVVGALFTRAGEVFTGRSADSLRPARARQQISSYDYLRTDLGTAMLLLTDGSIVLIAANTSVQMGTVDVDAKLRRRVRIHLHRGEIHTIAKIGNDGSAFDVITRAAVAGVRGTSFRVAIDTEPSSGGAAAPRTRVETLTGKVELGGAKGAVPVVAGTGSRVGSSGVPEPPRALLAPATDLRPSHGPLRKNARLVWKGPVGAVGYRVEFARDADFAISPLTVKITSDTLAPPRALGSGQWYWRTTAIDADGFVGMPSKVYAFILE